MIRQCNIAMEFTQVPTVFRTYNGAINVHLYTYRGIHREKQCGYIYMCTHLESLANHDRGLRISAGQFPAPRVFGTLPVCRHTNRQKQQPRVLFFLRLLIHSVCGGVRQHYDHCTIEPNSKPFYLAKRCAEFF